MNKDEISDEDTDLWYELFIDEWYCTVSTIDDEMIQCHADATAGDLRAQEYWSKFIAAKLTS